MLKTVLYFAIIGLMVHWTQVTGSPGKRHDIQPHLYQEQNYEIYKHYPTSGWSYLRPPRSLPAFPWSFFKDEDDEEKSVQKRLDTLEKKLQELEKLVKKFELGEPNGESSHEIKKRVDSGSVESVEVNESQAMADDSESSENESLGSLKNFNNSNTNIRMNERKEISFSKIESNNENHSMDPTNTLLPVSQDTWSTIITNDPPTKISQDYQKDKANMGLTNTIMVTESNLVGLIPITNPTEGLNFLEVKKESYQSLREEKEFTPILIVDNQSSFQDPSGTQVSHENQDATQDTDDQSAIRFDRANPVRPSDIFGEFLSNHKGTDGTRMEQIKLSKNFEKVHQVFHNFEENKHLIETLSYLEKKNENKETSPYGFFRSLNKQIESNPLVAQADKIFNTGPSPKECSPCPEIKKEEKPICVLTTSKQDQKEETPQQDKTPSTPSASSPSTTDIKGTSDTKKDETAEEPVIKEPGKTEEKKSQEITPQNI